MSTIDLVYLFSPLILLNYKFIFLNCECQFFSQFCIYFKLIMYSYLNFILIAKLYLFLIFFIFLLKYIFYIFQNHHPQQRVDKMLIFLLLGHVPCSFDVLMI
jgi:hypothetical protein